MSTATTETRSASTTAKALGVILGIPVIIGLMLFAFLAPNFSSGPQDVPVAPVSYTHMTLPTILLV